MGIRAVFTYNRETLQFVVKDKRVTYTDRKLKRWIQIIPMVVGVLKEMNMSRNRIPRVLMALIIDCNKGKNYEEWKQAKDDNEVMDIIVKDAAKKGCRLQRRFEE